MSNCLRGTLPLSAVGGAAGTDLDVRVHIHERPFAVLAIDAQCELHLFVQQNAHFDSLFLQETRSNEFFSEWEYDQRSSLDKDSKDMRSRPGSFDGVE